MCVRVALFLPLVERFGYRDEYQCAGDDYRKDEHAVYAGRCREDEKAKCRPQNGEDDTLAM